MAPKLKMTAKGGKAGPLEQESDEERPLMFHMVNEKHGEFCQWYPSTFFVYKHEILEAVGQDRKEGDGYGTVWFSSAEQFMMYCKATRFGDHETQRRVMETKDPKEQKRLGRQTAGFTHAGWDEVKSAVVELAPSLVKTQAYGRSCWPLGIDCSARPRPMIVYGALDSTPNQRWRCGIAGARIGWGKL